MTALLRPFASATGSAVWPFFGSALRHELGPDSDLDVLVEFEPQAAVGLRFITLQTELSKLFDRRVDLLTAGFLSPHFRSRVLEEAVPLYEAA